MSVDVSEAMVILSTAVLKMQDDVKALHTLFLDNVTFIKGMGDVPDKMGEVLLSIVSDHDRSKAYAFETMKRSGDFFKNTTSQIYPNFNLIQEWFSEFAKEVVAIFTGLSEEYVQDWMIVKVQDQMRKYGKMASEMTYDERVVYGEELFDMVETELHAGKMCKYILRAIFIPYISLYYLRPFIDYPYFDEWKAELEVYKNRLMTQKV